MAQKLPMTIAAGAILQNTRVSPCRKTAFPAGFKANEMGQTKAHNLKTPPVPMRFCRGGKTASIQKAWDIPPMAMR
jgi:hypothetical protein